jgi:hypothetical protein
MNAEHRPPAPKDFTIRCIDPTTNRLGSVRLTVSVVEGQYVDGDKPLVCIQMRSGEQTVQAFTYGESAFDLGHAIANTSAAERLDDKLEPWDRDGWRRYLPNPGAWVRDAEAEMENPRATSEGHKRTIRTCRHLLDLLRQQEQRVLTAGDPPADTYTLRLEGMRSPEEAADALSAALNEVITKRARFGGEGAFTMSVGPTGLPPLVANVDLGALTFDPEAAVPVTADVLERFSYGLSLRPTLPELQRRAKVRVEKTGLIDRHFSADLSRRADVMKLMRLALSLDDPDDHEVVQALADLLTALSSTQGGA